MPHDRKGNLVNIGDTVSIICIVKSITAGEEYCNLTVVTKDPMPPYTDGYTLSLNTKQVEVIK